MLLKWILPDMGSCRKRYFNVVMVKERDTIPYIFPMKTLKTFDSSWSPSLSESRLYTCLTVRKTEQKIFYGHIDGANKLITEFALHDLVAELVQLVTRWSNVGCVHSSDCQNCCLWISYISEIYHLQAKKNYDSKKRSVLGVWNVTWKCSTCHPRNLVSQCVFFFLFWDEENLQRHWIFVFERCERTTTKSMKVSYIVLLQIFICDTKIISQKTFRASTTNNGLSRS